MKKLRFVTVSLVVLLGIALLLQSAAPRIVAQEDDSDDSVQRTINVSGTGQISAEPDVAVITVGVETQAEEAGAALSQNSEQMQTIID
ncbi:MAG: SIMPL domain-containing protein, partial [Anaerolineae bacterium]|nr:SIMPL domain-containing protein [Anaerolineae bacterium]